METETDTGADFKQQEASLMQRFNSGEITQAELMRLHEELVQTYSGRERARTEKEQS